jgi:hypothetical protein
MKYILLAGLICSVVNAIVGVIKGDNWRCYAGWIVSSFLFLAEFLAKAAT